MKFLPFENITYSTNLSSDEILEKLSSIIEPKKKFRMKGFFGNNSHKPYEGMINGKSFHMTRIINYRNSFLPRIDGVIENDFTGTKVKVKMKLHSFVKVFMIIWFGGVGIFCLLFLLLLLNDKNFETMTLIPFGMLIFGYALVTAGFKYESNKSKKFLAELFEAKIEQ